MEDQRDVHGLAHYLWYTAVYQGILKKWICALNIATETCSMHEL